MKKRKIGRASVRISSKIQDELQRLGTSDWCQRALQEIGDMLDGKTGHLGPEDAQGFQRMSCDLICRNRETFWEFWFDGF